MTGTEATHQIACFNPPTPEEAPRRKAVEPRLRVGPAAGRHDRRGGAGRIGSTADLEGLVADIQAEEGPLSLGPSAGGLPMPPEPEHHGERGIFHDD